MLRRIALASLALAMAFVVACGHQVTPEPTTDNLSGKMQIRFRTNGAMNFSAYTYAIVINTCGEGPPYAPEPNVYNTSFLNYSFAFLIGASYSQSFPVLEQYILTPSTTNQLNPQPVVLSPSTTNFILDSNENNNEFELTFPRNQLANPLGVSQPCPNITAATPTPSPSAGPSMTATPSAAPSTGATATPSAAPSATPSPYSAATTSAQQYWYFNFFSIANGAVQDSLGIGGATDDTFNGIGVETNLTQSYTISKATGGPVPSDPAAQIQGGEIDNYL